MLSKYTASLKIYCAIVLYAHVLIFISLFPLTSLILLVIAIPCIMFAMGTILVKGLEQQIIEECPGNSIEQRWAYYDLYYGYHLWCCDIVDEHGRF